MQNRDHENLTKTNMQKVITLLAEDKPITKKAACEILNISYNTTRLGKLVTEFKEKEIASKARRAKLRGTPLTDVELGLIAGSYLNGEALSSISDYIYRPTSLIKGAIKDLGIPERNADHSYFNPPLLELDSVKEEYEKDDLVFSARYGTPALIDARFDSVDGPVYVIYLLGKEQCSATQPYWELSDLSRVQNELKINIKPQAGLNPSYNPK
jgi:hypothetical protein